MDRFFVIILGLVFSCSVCEAQQAVTWDELMDVQFNPEYDTVNERSYWYPTFGVSVQKLEGKRIRVTGYLIPVDLEQGVYVLSAYPFAACYFCGNAGPESVMALRFSESSRRFSTDEISTFEGTLELNRADVDELNYILLNCREVKSNE